jgi:hypothetical protein
MPAMESVFMSILVELKKEIEELKGRIAALEQTRLGTS